MMAGALDALAWHACLLFALLACPTTDAASVSSAVLAQLPGDMPPEWAAGVAAGFTVVSTGDTQAVPGPDPLPALSNGYLGFTVDGQSFYVSGMYSGAADANPPSHRAAIPSPVLLHMPCASSPEDTDTAGEHTLQSQARFHWQALHMREGVWTRRGYLNAQEEASVGFAPCDLSELQARGMWEDASAAFSCSRLPSRVWWEERRYAHRHLKSLQVVELVLIGSDEAVSAPVDATASGGRGSGPLVYMDMDMNMGKDTKQWHDGSGGNSAIMIDDFVALLRLGSRSSNLGSNEDVDIQDMTSELIDGNPLFSDIAGTVSLHVGYCRAAEVSTMLAESFVMLTARLPDGNLLTVKHVGDVYTILSVVKTSLDVLPHVYCPTTTLDATASLTLPDAILGRRGCSLELDALAASRSSSAPTGGETNGRSVDLLTRLVALAVHEYRAAKQLERWNVLLTSHVAGWSSSSSSQWQSDTSRASSDIAANDKSVDDATNVLVFGMINRWPHIIQTALRSRVSSLLTTIHTTDGTATPTLSTARGNEDTHMDTLALRVLGLLLPPPLWDSLVLPVHARDQLPSDIAAVAISSQYSLLSFSRSDWPMGSSPGGLSTNGYNVRAEILVVVVGMCVRASATRNGFASVTNLHS